MAKRTNTAKHNVPAELELPLTLELLLLKLGAVLAGHRKERSGQKLTQTRLAKKAGITQAYLSEIECGKVSATIPTLSRICEALDVSVAEVFVEAELKEDTLTGVQRGALELTLGLLRDLRNPRHHVH